MSSKRFMVVYEVDGAETCDVWHVNTRSKWASLWDNLAGLDAEGVEYDLFDLTVEA